MFVVLVWFKFGIYVIYVVIVLKDVRFGINSVMIKFNMFNGCFFEVFYFYFIWMMERNVLRDENYVIVFWLMGIFYLIFEIFFVNNDIVKIFVIFEFYDVVVERFDFVNVSKFVFLEVFIFDLKNGMYM